MNTRGKNYRNILRAKKYLEDKHWIVFRITDQAGLFDLLAVSQTKTMLVHVASNRWTYRSDERNPDRFTLPVPENCVKIVLICKDGVEKPDLKKMPNARVEERRIKKRDGTIVTEKHIVYVVK